MKQKLNKNNKIEVKSEMLCPKCSTLMTRVKRVYSRIDSYWFTEWDKCTICRHIQHYPQYFRQPTKLETKIIEDNYE